MRGVIFVLTLMSMVVYVPVSHASDERDLTRAIQLDLQALGHEIDDTSGRLTLQTRLAIGAVEEKYGQAATGKPTFDIAAKLRAERRAQNPGYIQANQGYAQNQQPCVCPQGYPQNAPAGAPVPNVPLQPDSACLQAKVNAKGGGKASRIGSAASRLLGRYGNRDVVDKAYKATQTAQDVVATTNDVKTIANELGLSEAEVNECMK